MALKSSTTHALYIWIAFHCIIDIYAVPANDDTFSQALKLIRHTEQPLVLLWGEERPSSLGNFNCWESKFDAYGFQHSVRHLLTTAANEYPPKRWNNQRNHAQVHLTLSGRGNNVLLRVEVTGTPTIRPMIEGSYKVHYADELCAVIGPKEGDSGVCTAWALASSANFMHKKCRTAFVENCASCKKSTENRSS
uniref:Lipocalin n=1 Tax=Rhipicephalus zambeziensis TaxID=60191 RepID=A0A224Y822_9ACAR